MGAFTLTARTFPGDLAELERILREIGMDMSVGMGKVAERAARGGDSGTDPAYDVKLRKILCAYFQVCVRVCTRVRACVQERVCVACVHTAPPGDAALAQTALGALS